MSSAPVTIDVVVVSYNSAADLPACLESVAAAATATVRPRVIVVDNDSTDGSAELVESAYPSARLVRSGGNLGFARAVNVGAATGDGDFVLLLNPDASLLPGALESLVAFALEHPEHGLYGGRVVQPDGTNDPSSCWGAMTLWSSFCFATGLSTAFPRHHLLDPESLGRWARDTVQEVPVITGCLLLARRSTWEALGGMDETYWLYGEDADLSLRARAQGLRPVVVPSAEILHSKGGSSVEGNKMPLVMAGKATLMRRRWRQPARALGLALLTCGVALRALLGRVGVGGAADWAGVWSRRAVWRRGYPGARALVAAPAATTAGAERAS
jgi:GT2 family glycosyltransferase